MIWILSHSCMCADFLEACINGIDLQSLTNNYRIYTNSNSVADVTEIERKEGQENGLKADVVQTFTDNFVKWAQDKGDTVIRTRHINNPVMSLISEMNETDPSSTPDADYISFLQDRMVIDNELTTTVRNLPYLDQNDYLTPITDKLEALVPDFNVEQHSINLNWYLKVNLQGIKDVSRINSILTKTIFNSYEKTRGTSFNDFFEKKELIKLKGFKMKLHNNKLDLISGWSMISDEAEGVGVEMEILEETENSVTVKILKIDKQKDDVREYQKRPPGMYG